MKKRLPAELPVVPKEILDMAKNATSLDRSTSRSVSKCTVCGDPCAPTSNEQLCWVCRRLKISAWRDSDIQMNAQE